MDEGVLDVYFDGQCPLCRREISFYRKLNAKGEINWINIESEGFEKSKTGIEKEALKARLHVVKDNKEVFTGGYAFLQLWSSITAFSWISRVLNNYFFPRLLDKIYDWFLLIRPVLQKLLIKIDSKNSS